MIGREEEVDKLTTNSLISDLVAINKKYEFWPLNNTSNRSCDMCNKPESMDFCVDCLKYMCRTCSAAHAKWPALKTHKTLEVSSENEPIIELRKKVPLCKTHRKEVVSFCLTCRIGVCEDCRDSCPDDHVFDDLHSHCKDKRKEINTSVKASTEVILKYSECIEKFDTKKHDLLQEKEEALNEVDVIMNLVRELLERKASGMRSDIDEKYARKCQQLDVELENVTKEKTKLLSRVEYLKFLHEYGSDAHIVTECDDSLSCCTAMCVKPNLDNLETFIIDFRRNPSLEQMLRGLNIGTVDNYYIENEAFDNETYDPSTLEKDVKEIFQQPRTHKGNLKSSESDCSVDEEERELQAPFRRRPQSAPRSLEILPPPVPPRDLVVQPSYAESSKRVIRSRNLDEHKESNEKMFAYNRNAKSLDWIDGQNLHQETPFNERVMKEASNELVYHYAGSYTSDDYTFQSDSSLSEGELYEDSTEPKGEQKSQTLKDEKEKIQKASKSSEERVLENAYKNYTEGTTKKRKNVA
ncbi:hypothetical protein FSP39_002229 [Pinctada imbricata]|uniref:B box-type domain-containing protein n=1 Tax=Pinctada imbricata TaxID=66713 RepID=A0AA88YGY2_PINIB|nr:hypothetical protein FSP39_002229 [Pinctada imbricata]